MKKMWLCIAFVILMVIATGCARTPTKIRIGVNDWPPCEVWYVAQQQGYFEELDVEIVRFSTWTDNMNSLYLGNIDVTHSTYFNNIFYSMKGEWGEMIAPIDTTVGGDGLVIKNDYESISDLVGKKIAVEIGTDEHYLLFKALEENGVAIDAVEIISAPSAKTSELFINGEVDAIFTYEPYMSKAANNGDGKIVFTTADIPGRMVDVLVANHNKVDEDIEAYVKLLSAYHKALAYIEEEGDYEMMATNEGFDVASFEAFYKSFTFFTPSQALEHITSLEYEQVHRDMTDFVLNNQLSNSVKPMDEIVNTQLLEKLIQEK